MYRQSEKKLLNGNISSICFYNVIVNFGLLTELGHPSKFQRLARLGFVNAATLLNGGEPNFARCLAVSCIGILYLHFWGLLPVG